MNLVVSLVVSVCAATVTVWLSLRRYRTERWWEHKAEAYSRIINALHALAAHLEARADAELGEGYDQAEDDRRRSEGDRAAIELQKATEIGAYVISAEAADALSRLRYRPRPGMEEGDWYAVFASDRDAYTRALAEIRALAKADLGIEVSIFGSGD